MRNRVNVIRLVFVLFFVFVFFVAAYQAYAYVYLSTSTEHATRIECEDRVSVTGYFLRDETPIDIGSSKYVDITVNNGDKIARGGVIANVYSTEGSAKAHAQMRELQTRIDEIREVVETSRGYKSGVSYSGVINKDAVAVSSAIGSGEINRAFEKASEFTSNVIMSKISSGEIVDYSDKLSALEAQMNELQSSSTAVDSYITVQSSGYFVRKTDGLESVLDLSSGDDISASRYNDIVNSCEGQPQQNPDSIGKLVAGSVWRVCFKSDNEKFSRLSVGSSVYVRVPSVTDSKIKCSVIGFENSDGVNYVVLESNVVTGNILSQRKCDIEVVVDSYSGLRVGKSAIRKIDGVDGVFAKYNGIIRYRKVHILYIGSTFAVVEYSPLDGSSLQVFDEVVVKGSNLYDGKVVS